MLRTLALSILICCSNAVFAQNTILWEIRKPGTQHISYLLGTYHQMGNSFVDSLPLIKEKLLHADLAVFESADASKTVKEILNRQPVGNDIERTFRKKDIEALMTLSAGWGVDIHKLKPVQLLVKLQQEYFKKYCAAVLPTDQWDHFDNYLIHLAETNNIAIAAFETDSMQTAIINSMGSGNWADYKKPITEWLHNHSKGTIENLCNDTKLYMSFQLDYNFNAPCSNDILIEQRNQKWLPVLTGMLQQHNCFVAVGLLHLFRKCGLIEQLRAMGYTVTPVELAKH